MLQMHLCECTSQEPTNSYQDPLYYVQTESRHWFLLRALQPVSQFLQPFVSCIKWCGWLCGTLMVQPYLGHRVDENISLEVEDVCFGDQCWCNGKYYGFMEMFLPYDFSVHLSQYWVR